MTHNTIPSHRSDRIFRYLFYTTNQIADRFPSVDADGDDDYDLNFYEDDYSVLNIIDDVPSSVPFEKTEVFYNETADFAFVYSIRAIAGLLEWFATETGMLNKITVKNSFEGGTVIINSKPKMSGSLFTFASGDPISLYVSDQDFIEPNGTNYFRVFNQWKKIVNGIPQTTYDDRSWQTFVIEDATYIADFNKQFNVNISTPPLYLENESGGSYNITSSDNVYYPNTITWNGTFIQYKDQPIIVEAIPATSNYSVVAWEDANGVLRSNDGKIINSNPFILEPTDHVTNLRAVFKKHLISTSSTALSSNNQRKITKAKSLDPITWNPIYGSTMVYESGGNIFTTSSYDNGASWSTETLIDGLSNSSYTYKSPSVTFNGSYNWYTWQKVNQQSASSWNNIIKVSDRPDYSDYVYITQFATSTEFDASPVIAHIPPTSSPGMYFVVWDDVSNLGFGIIYFASYGWEVFKETVPGSSPSSRNASIATDYVPGTTNPYRIYVVWEEDNSFGGTYIGYARAEFATTTPSVGTVDWSSPAGLPSSSMSEVSSKPSITLDANGNTCIAWQSFDPATSISKIKFQKKNRNGSDVTGSEHEFVISGAGNLPTAPSLCSYRNSQTRPNDLALVWQTQQGTMLARYENSVWSEPFLYTIQGQSPNIEADFFDGNDPIMVYTMTNGSLYSVMSSAIRQNSVSSTLNANWNMVGIPAQVSNFGVDALYPNRTSNVFAYQGGYVIKTTLENGLGYWLKMPATETKTYLGWPLNTHIVPVAAGWNMIGSLSTSLATNKIHSTPSDIIQSDFTTYSSDGYVSSTTLEPGKGYWVKVSATGDLQLDPTASEIIPPGTLPIEPPPNPEAPGKPTLLEPLNNGTNFPTIVDFNWEEEPYATSYRFQLSTSSQFLSFVVHDSTLAVNSKTVSSLGYSTTYYWRVRAANEYGESEWSSMRQFTTTVPPPQPPPIPTLVSPPNYATNQATSLYLSWNISSGSDKYWLQVSTTSNFSTTVINDSNITTTSRLVPSLQSSTTYHWRVKAINTAGASGWSGSWRFTTQSSDPDPCITYSSYQQMDELTITDSGGNSQTLYMRNRGLALGQKMNKNDKMPPEPPPGLFHAKFKSGRFLENIPAGQGRKVIPLVIKDASYPVTISWNVKSNNFTNYWLKSHGNGKKKHTLMHGQGQVIIDKPKKQDDVIWITAEASIPCPGPTLTRPMYPEQDVITSAKPEQFLLEQNHPNPFNPVTVIRYQLSEDAQVKLSVFNTLGVEVASLVNEFQGAGFKSVTFDASNISSGVYFYRLTARNLSSSDAPRHGAEGTHSGHPSSGSGQGYIDIKKMVIMK